MFSCNSKVIYITSITGHSITITITITLPKNQSITITITITAKKALLPITIAYYILLYFIPAGGIGV